MINRCYNKNTYGYKWYGAKGVTVCDRWLNSYEAFVEDLGDIPAPLSVDRIDSCGNYEPSNVRLIDRKHQQRNSSAAKEITYKGETKCIREWAEAIGVKVSTLSARLNRLNWPIERALGEYNVR